MGLTAVREVRKIGYVSTMRGPMEAARQRDRLRLFGCDYVFERNAKPGWSALHDAIAALAVGDQFVMCNVMELALPSFVLGDLVARHGATFVELER